MSDAAGRGSAEVAIRDGSEVLVRPIEPSDKDALRSALDRLGPESRYRRFLSPMRQLTRGMLRYLTEVDHHDHEALVAFDPESGEPVGIARFVRISPPETAELGIAVVDDWQGRGVGTALLELLAGRAREEGIARFTALVLATNADVIDLLRRLGSMRVVGREGECVEVEADLPEAGLHPGLRELLRESADARSPVEPAATLVPGA